MRAPRAVPKTHGSPTQLSPAHTGAGQGLPCKSHSAREGRMDLPIPAYPRAPMSIGLSLSDVTDDIRGHPTPPEGSGKEAGVWQC